MSIFVFTDEQVVAIRQAVANKTKTKNQIAAEYGIGERSVRNLLNGYSYSHVKDAILPTKPNKNGIGEEKRQQIVDCYAQTHSMYVVAETVGVSRNTVAAVLKDRGIQSDGRVKSVKQKEKTRESNQRRVRPLKTAKSAYQPQPLTPQKQATLRKLIKANWKAGEIAEMLDLPRKDAEYFIKNGVS